MNEEQKRKLRREGFWIAPPVRKQGDPNVKHPNWNPHENKEIELEFD